MQIKKGLFIEKISTFPKDVREKYLLNLEFRNNGKYNVKYNIARDIFAIVESKKTNIIDENKLRLKYKLTESAFRFHKSKILNDIRELTFSNHSPKASSDNTKDGLTEKHATFINHYINGNMERHKNEFLLFEKEIKRKNKKNLYQVILSDIQRVLMIYYFHKRNYIRFNYFYGSIIKTFRKVNTGTQLKNKDKSLIKINYLWAEYYKCSFNWINNNDLNKSEKYIYEIFRESKKHNIAIHHLSTLIIKMWMSRNKNDLVNMAMFAQEGYKQSIDYNENFISNYFKAYMHFGDMLSQKINGDTCADLVGHLYEKVKQNSPYSNITKYLLDIYTQIMFSVDEGKGIKLLKESSELCFIAGHTYDGIYNQFVYHFYSTLNSIIEYEIINNEEEDNNFIRIKFINHSLLSEFEKNINQLLNFNKNIFAVKFLSDIYLAQGMVDIFKGKNVDLKKAILIQQKNDRLRRTRNFISNDWYFITIRSYFRLKGNTNVFKKDNAKKEDCIIQLIKQAEYFYDRPSEIGKLEFNILLYISQLINSDKYTIAIKKLYHWLLVEKKGIFEIRI